MRHLALFLFFLLTPPLVLAQDTAKNWSAGGGYSGINFDHEVLPFGVYTHAERRVVGDLFAAWHVSWHTKSEKDDIVKIRESLTAAMTGLMYEFPFRRKLDGANPVLMYTSIMFGLENWRVSGHAQSPVLGQVDLSGANNGWAAQITLGLKVPVAENLSVNVSGAYRTKWYNIEGLTSSLNDFVWHGGVAFRF